MSASGCTPIGRAYFSASLAEFLAADENTILGHLAAAAEHDQSIQQRNAWRDEIRILRDQLHGTDCSMVFLELKIPRMGKRADAALIIRSAVIVLEFKIGESVYASAALAQAVDYALDLKNFHEGSHAASIIPIVIATAANPAKNTISFHTDRVANCQCCNARDLRQTVTEVIAALPPAPEVEGKAWANSRYKPTPTIIEAARALYRDHSVAEIARSDASAINLSETTQAISEIIEAAKAKRQKAICFVTGVPGAGKTLAGLNITTDRMRHHSDEHAVFLSGNGPLVSVLRAALARDQKERTSVSLKDANRNAHAFIQNIHHFRDSNLASNLATVEKVVVFDEAQRAWDQEHTSKFMRTKRDLTEFHSSEPEFLIEVMDRHADWCVIIALVGGGQEINSGEAGLPEWFRALRARFSHWQVFYSDRFATHEYSSHQPVGELTAGLHSSSSPSLHLGVSLRSFRAETLSKFVGHVIDNEPDKAASCYSAIRENYPVLLTRSLPVGQRWLRWKKRGSELIGLTAYSGARRLRPEGMDVAAKIEPEVWFLNDSADVRSCHYLEEVATEFDIQGLELDWSLVGWDANLRRDGNAWAFRKFRGTRWEQVCDETSRRYLLNAHRVLLTRARQGLVIFVPKGDPNDPTRLPEYYDPVADYLLTCGIRSLTAC